MTHRHHHHHHDPSAHRVGRLDPLTLASSHVHRLGRRRFLADLGRRTFAVAILGAGAAACSSDPPPSQSSDGSAEPSTTSPPPAGDQLAWSQAVLGNVSAYVLARGNEAAVVDTGRAGDGALIGNTLSELGLTFGDVAHVVLTHHHGDHIGGLGEVLTEASNSTVYAGEADIGSIRSDSPLQPVGDGDSVFGLDVLHTPGHTPGSISLFDTEIGLLVAGDALNGNAQGDELRGAAPQFSVDMGQADDSVRRLAMLEGVESVAMGHGQPVTSGAGVLLAELADSL